MSGQDWRIETAIKLGLAPVYTPAVEDFVLLFLYADGRSPVYGEEILHAALFLYPYIPLKLSPSVFLPLSSDIENSLQTLKEKGLVEERREYRSGGHVVSLRLTDKGVAEAKRLFSAFSGGWVLLNGFVLRRGSEVISEIEALKKTYNGRSALELLKLLAAKLESEGDAFLKRLELQGRSGKVVLEIAKQLARDLKVLTREPF